MTIRSCGLDVNRGRQFGEIIRELESWRGRSRAPLDIGKGAPLAFGPRAVAPGPEDHLLGEVSHPFALGIDAAAGLDGTNHRVVPPTDAVIRAVQACSRINAQCEWVDPPKQVIFSSDVQRHVSPEGQRRASSDVQRRSANGPATLELPDNLPKLPPAIDVQPAISNRHTPRLENVVCHSKQTTAPVSNGFAQQPSPAQ